jgi:transposase-like protein
MPRIVHTPAFKKKVALEALREDKTLNQIASEYKIHPVQVSLWKKELLDGCEAIFADKRKRPPKEDITREMLEQTIGQQKVELDFLKKKLAI